MSNVRSKNGKKKKTTILGQGPCYPLAWFRIVVLLLTTKKVGFSCVMRVLIPTLYFVRIK